MGVVCLVVIDSDGQEIDFVGVRIVKSWSSSLSLEGGGKSLYHVKIDDKLKFSFAFFSLGYCDGYCILPGGTCQVNRGQEQLSPLLCRRDWYTLK